MSHKHLKAQLAISLMVFIACCSSHNASKDTEITFYDDFLKEAMLEHLRDANIPFDIRGNTIWYPHEYENKVEQISHEALAERPLPFEFPDKRVRDHFANLLREKGFKIILRDTPNLHKVYVSQDKYAEASKILDDMEEKCGACLPEHEQGP